uniref:flagellar biosynthetic protein FliR n=1 Tax=Yoonia sp. TaxID=2212373 RepID=UPI004047BC55
MIADLASLVPIAQSLLWLGFAVFVRVGAMMAVLPIFGEQSVPLRLRLGVTLAFTAIVAPALETSIGPAPVSLIGAVQLLGPEVFAGLFFGLGLRFFVFVLQIAGSIAAQSTSLSQIFGGTAGVDPLPAMGRFFVVGGLALAAILGLHVRFAAYMLQSYQMLPFGVLIAPELMMTVGVQEVSRTFALGFTLAAPFVVASLIYNVTLGVINRAMPQLLVSFIGAPAITAGGMIMILIATPVLLAIWMTAFGDFLAAPFEVR